MAVNPATPIQHHVWQTLWLVVGPRWPAAEIRIRGNIVLGPLEDDAFEYYKKTAVPVPTIIATTDNFVVHYPPRDVVQSRQKLQVDITDSDQETALDRATAIVNRLLLSLSLAIPGGRYRAELRKFRRADENTEYSAWSQSVGVTPWSPPQHIERRDVEQSLGLFDAVSQDEVAENAHVHLMTAWQLQDTVGSKPLQRSILQHFVLCMETIVNGVMTKVKATQRDRIRLEERVFAEEFLRDLAKRADKPEAIRSASTKLREIGLLNMVPSIEKVAPILRLPDDLKEQAKDLYRFRSSSLSHPGRTKEADLRRWLQSGPTVSDICLADLIARRFLAAYCTHAVERV